MRHTTNITSAETWYAKDNPHIIAPSLSTLKVTGDLTIEAGCKIYVNQNKSLELDNNVYINGTVEKPVLFTANTSSPSRGWWGTVDFYGWTNNLTVNIQHAIFEYYYYIEFSIYDTNPTITVNGCIFRHTSDYAISAGGAPGTNLSIENCKIYDCDGSGIYIWDNITWLIKNCLIHDVAGDGIELWAKGDSGIVENCTLDNYNKWNAGYSGITRWHNLATSVTQVKNCIVTNNAGVSGWIYGIHSKNPGKITVSYSNVWNNSGGNFVGCIDEGNNTEVDPKYVGGGDYHLQSTRASHHNGSWTPDSDDSPCIDTGDPASDYSNEPDYNGGRINKGGDGNTEEASRSIDSVSVEAYSIQADWDSGIKTDVDSNISVGRLMISSEAQLETISQDMGTTEVDVYNVYDIGQGFITTKRRLKKVSLYGKKVGAPPNNCVLKLWHSDDNNVFKPASFLAQVSKTPTDFSTTFSYIDFELSPELDLPIGTKLLFTLEMEGDSSNSSNKYVFARSDDDQYANGHMVYSSDDWATTYSNTGYDLRFKISEADVKTSGTWTKDFEGTDTTQWGKLYFKGEGVSFRFKSADTQGELDTAPWSSYITTSGADIPVIDKRWIRIEVKLQ